MLLLVSSGAVALRVLLAPRTPLAGCQHPLGLEGEVVLGDDPCVVALLLSAVPTIPAIAWENRAAEPGHLDYTLQTMRAVWKP